MFNIWCSKGQDTYLCYHNFPQFYLCSLSHNLAHKQNLTFVRKRSEPMGFEVKWQRAEGEIGMILLWHRDPLVAHRELQDDRERWRSQKERERMRGWSDIKSIHKLGINK